MTKEFTYKFSKRTHQIISCVAYNMSDKFYEINSFIFIFLQGNNWPLSLATQIQSAPSNSTSFNTNSILSVDMYIKVNNLPCGIFNSLDRNEYNV